MTEVHTTSTCKYCNGLYYAYGACPKFGLKFRNSFCAGSEISIKYKIVKVRNNNPWYKFWNLYNYENHIIK